MIIVKKVLVILFSFILIFSLVACSNLEDNIYSSNFDSSGTVTENKNETILNNNGKEDEITTNNGENSVENIPTSSENNKDDNKENDIKNETTRPTIKDETPQNRDDTMFNSYETFLKETVETETFSLKEVPSNLSSLNSVCDCNIVFSGDLKNGSVSVKIGNENHTHGWGTTSSKSETKNSTLNHSASVGISVGQSISNSSGQVIDVCDKCGFVKGNNFIFIKLPNKSHGHGWSWPNKTPNENIKPTPKPEIDSKPEQSQNCKCGYYLIGDYDNGSLTVKINGKEHSHSWSSSTSKSISSDLKDSINNFPSSNQGISPWTSTSTSKGKSESTSESYGTIGGASSIGMTGVPPCTFCGFRRYSNIYGDKIITFRCQKDKTKPHEINFTTFNKINEKVDCICGMYATGNSKNGSFSFAKGVDTHAHGWASAVSSSIKQSNTYTSKRDDKMPSTDKSTVSAGSMISGMSDSVSSSSLKSVYKCSDCKWKEVDNGFIIKCPLTEKYHVINYN